MRKPAPVATSRTESSTRSISGCQRRRTSSAPLSRWARSRLGALTRAPFAGDGPSSLATARAGLAARSVIGLDLPACRREHVPAGAECLRALSLGLARLPVLDEPVERMASVGDLFTAVCTLGHSEQRPLHTGTSQRLAVGEQRRSLLRAPSIAGAATVLVLLEQVERAAPAVDEDATEPRVRDADLGRGGDAVRGARLDGRAVRP